MELCALDDLPFDDPVHWVGPGATVTTNGISMPSHRPVTRLVPAGGVAVAGTAVIVGPALPTRPDFNLCPARVRSSIDAYCELGIPPGDFVRCVLANDLYGAVTRADDVNLRALPHVVAYVVKRVPASICGSVAAVNNHIDAKADEWRTQGRPDVRDEVQP